MVVIDNIKEKVVIDDIKEKVVIDCFIIYWQRDMDQVWKNLELIENSYEQMFLKTHRIQANRVCLGDLTGKIPKFYELRWQIPTPVGNFWASTSQLAEIAG